MRYYDAARQILRSAGHPLTTREITEQAIAQGLIAPVGKTPIATMKRVLYVRLREDPELVKIQESGNTRAKRFSVYWTLRSATSANRERLVVRTSKSACISLAFSGHDGVVKAVVSQPIVTLDTGIRKRGVLIAAEREHGLVHLLGVEDSQAYQ